MKFWENTGYKFNDLVDLPFENLIILINSMDRQDIVKWLMWNDPNGIYNDELSLKELGNIMSRDEGIEILLRQIEENRVIS
jgi:hypothetical protein